MPLHTSHALLYGPILCESALINSHITFCSLLCCTIFQYTVQQQQILSVGDDMAEFRDLFFKHYPFLIANAVHCGFFYLCPGTRHLYGTSFKRILYLECVRLLTGVDVMPVSILDTRAKLFPEEAHEDVTAANVTSTSAAATASSGLDYLPPLLNHAATSANGTTNMILHNASNSGNNSTSSATVSVPHSTGDVGSYHGGVLSEYDKQHHGDNSVHSIVSDASSLMSGSSNSSAAHSRGNYYFSGRKEHYRPVYHRPHCDGDTSQQQQATGASSNSTASTTTTCKQAAAARRIKSEIAISVHMKAMSKTYRPQPLGHLTGDRSSLRFKPPVPDNLCALKPHQERTQFDTSQISPMLQAYLRIDDSTAGRRSERIARTVPVRWCETGGVDTFRKFPNRKEHHEAIAAQRSKARKEYEQSRYEDEQQLRAALKKVDAEETRMLSCGARQIGLKSLDITSEQQQQQQQQQQASSSLITRARSAQ
jgi:Protein of unknown function